MFNPQMRRNSKRGTKVAEKFSPNIPAQGLGYEYTTGNRWMVYLDGKHIGHIHQLETGFQYRTRFDRSAGEIFATQAECRASLED